MFKKITLNTLASAGGRVIGGLLALFSVSFIARSLGADGFGQYSTIVAYLATFQIFADFGLYTLLTREISQKPDKEKELVSHFFTLRLVLAAGFLFLGAVLVWLFPYSEAVKLGAAYAAAGFLFLSLSQIFLSIFQKHLQVHKAAIAEVLGRAAQLGVVWYFFTTNGNLSGYILALVIGSFVIFAANFVFARGLVSFRIKASAKEWRKIIKITFPIAISLVFTLLYFKADTILLSVLRPQRDVGIYSAAYRVLEVLIFFPAAFIGIVMPTLSKYAKESKEKFAEFFNRLNNLMIISALPVAVGGAILASTFVFYIGGEEFLVATLTLQILFAAIAIIFFGTLYGNSAVALGLQKKAMWVYIGGFIFNFTANLVVIPQYTYVGAAATTVATELIVTVWLFYIIKKGADVKFSFTTTAKAALSAALMGAVVWYWAQPLGLPLNILDFALALSLGVAVYFVAIGGAGLFKKLKFSFE